MPNRLLLFIKELPIRIWLGLTPILWIVVDIALQRLADAYFPIGSEVTTLTRILLALRDILAAVPIGALLAFSLGALFWDERERIATSLTKMKHHVLSARWKHGSDALLATETVASTRVLAAPRLGNFQDFRISYAQPNISEPLAGFIARCDAMIAEGVGTQEALADWKIRFQDWDDDLRRFMRSAIGESQTLSFFEFANIPVAGESRFAQAFNDEHNTLLNRLQRRRKELRRIHALYVD